MIDHLHHINLLVKDLSTSMEYFNKLFDQIPSIESLSHRAVNTATYKLRDTYFVLVQPSSESGVVADILREKGPGLFLLSFGTDSIENTLAHNELVALDRRVGINNWDICDIPSFQDSGAIFQLCSTAGK